MFYERFLRLCNQAGRSPSAVAHELGLQKSSVHRWKLGATPTDANLQKLADYFGVPAASLTGGADEASADAGLSACMAALRARPELRALLRPALNASPEDVEMAARLVEALLNKK